eukprot:UN03245
MAEFSNNTSKANSNNGKSGGVNDLLALQQAIANIDNEIEDQYNNIDDAYNNVDDDNKNNTKTIQQYPTDQRYIFSHFNKHNDTIFSLRCLTTNGTSFANTANYNKVVLNNNNNTTNDSNNNNNIAFIANLQLLKFINNDVYYTDEQITLLLSGLDYNNYIYNTNTLVN